MTTEEKDILGIVLDKPSGEHYITCYGVPSKFRARVFEKRSGFIRSVNYILMKEIHLGDHTEVVIDKNETDEGVTELRFTVSIRKGNRDEVEDEGVRDASGTVQEGRVSESRGLQAAESKSERKIKRSKVTPRYSEELPPTRSGVVSVSSGSSVISEDLTRIGESRGGNSRCELSPLDEYSTSVIQLRRLRQSGLLGNSGGPIDIDRIDVSDFDLSGIRSI